MTPGTKPAPASLAALLNLAAEAYGDRPALVARVGLRDEAWTYREFRACVGCAAHRFRDEFALQPGDRLLIRGDNGPALAAAYFGGWLARLVVVPVDRHSTPEFIAQIAHATEAAAVLSDEAGRVPSGLQAIPLAICATKAADPGPLEEPGAEETAEIVFTSGTTGAPKGVVLTHGNITANVAAITHLYPREPGQRFLSLLPLSHMLEQTAGLFTPLLLGATIFYPQSRHPAALLDRIRRSRISGAVVVPQLLGVLWNALDAASAGRHWLATTARLPFNLRRQFARAWLPRLGHDLRFFVCGGAALPAPLEAAWESIGVRVVQGYGATECAPIVAANGFDHRVPATIGRPVPRVEVRLGEASEIQVRGPNVTRGYWRNPAATQSAFTADGWYRTGDRGAVRADGALQITGRCRDMIALANGLNVFPEDIEPLLAAQPGIAGCVVLDLPDPQGQPVVTAVLRLAEQEAPPDQREATARSAVQAANRHLASHQRIGEWRLWEGDFPRTPLLKIKRGLVREALLGEAERAPLAAADANIAGDDVLRSLLAAACRIDPARIEAGADLEADLGLDSLGRVALATAIEQRLGVQVDDADLAGLKTVEDLAAQIERARDKPPTPPYPEWPLSGPVRGLRRVVRQGILFPALDWFCDEFRVEGAEMLASLDVPALFIANHASHADTASILRALPPAIARRIAVAAAADYFFEKPLASIGVRIAINAFPFVRVGSVRPSLEYCGELVEAGWSVLIYPEGTRSDTGELQAFKPGVGLLTTGLRVSIVPIAVSGGRDILPKGRIRPRRGAVRVRFGSPLRLDEAISPADATELLRSAVARLLE